MKINQLLTSPEYQDSYKFLKTNEDLGSNIMFLTFGGSHAYGTNVDGSDIDIRGVMHTPAKTLLGFGNTEQYVDKNTDTTIYTFNKFVQLAAKCNPNVIELLGCNEYTQVSTLGQELLDNKEMFLSQQAFASFNGYAMSQLRRFKNILSRGEKDPEELEHHIKESLEDYLLSLEGRYEDFQSESVSFCLKADKDGILKTHCQIKTKSIPVKELSGIMNEITNIAQNAEKLSHRNNKKDDLHINKHAMHLVRLYLMGIDLLKDGKIITFREKDRDFLLNIRNGYYQNENGLYKQEFFDIIEQYKTDFDNAKASSVLPKKADMKKIEDFVVSVNFQHI